MMTALSSAAGYRQLMRHREARRLIAALCAAWLSFGMVHLALFLTAHAATESYGASGIVVAGFSLGSASFAPFRGRLIDRRGHRPWLFLLASGYAVALGALTLLSRGAGSPWSLTACAAAAGAFAPPLLATVRGLWPKVVESAMLRRSYAVTSLIGDIGLVVAPAIGGLLFAFARWTPLALCGVAAVVASGIVAHAKERPVAKPRSLQTSSAASAASGFRVVLGVSICLGAALGLVEVAVPAMATRWNAQAFSGALIGAFALGSVMGTLWFGHRDWKRPPEQRYFIAVAILGLALPLPIIATGPAMLAPLLAVVGLGCGPATVSLFEMLDYVVSARATEAFAWVTTAEAIGTAAGAAASGSLVADVGTWAPFALAAGLLLLGSALGLRSVRSAALAVPKS